MTLGELVNSGIVHYDWIALYRDGDFIGNYKVSVTDGFDYVTKNSSTEVFKDYIVECLYPGRVVDTDGRENPKLSIDIISPKKSDLLSDLRNCKEFIKRHPHNEGLIEAIDKAIDIVKKGAR